MRQFAPLPPRTARTSRSTKPVASRGIPALYSAHCSQRHNKERAIMPSRSIRLLLPVLALIAGMAVAACGTAATPEWAAEAQATQVAMAATNDHLTAIAPTATFTSTPTDTPIPPTATPTDTPVPPTATPALPTPPSRRRPHQLKKSPLVVVILPDASPLPIPPTGR